MVKESDVKLRYEVCMLDTKSIQERGKLSKHNYNYSQVIWRWNSAFGIKYKNWPKVLRFNIAHLIVLFVYMFFFIQNKSVGT